MTTLLAPPPTTTLSRTPIRPTRTLPPTPPEPPPEPMTGPTPAPELSLTSVPFHGRTLAEYVASFALDLTALRRRLVLDVGAGPSSFAVEAARRGVDVAAVDPMYGSTLATLATYVQLDYARVAVEAGRRLKGARLAARQELEAERRVAAQRFLGDYESGFLHNRYIGGGLPRLPFLDGAFDLVVCGHLLFSPESPFEGASLVEATLELVRVSAGEVRIGPMSGLSTAEAESYLGALRDAGMAAERISVPGPLTGGRQILLVLKRAI